MEDNKPDGTKILKLFDLNKCYFKKGQKECRVYAILISSVI